MKTAEERLAWASAVCAQLHIRLTPVRQAALRVLAAERLPMELEAITQRLVAHGVVDATTVYRTLMILQDAGVVRTVSAGLRKSKTFVLRVPGDGGHFFVCERCGAAREFDPPAALLHSIGEDLNYVRFASGELMLEIRGVCEQCERQNRNATKASKLMPRSMVHAPARNMVRIEISGRKQGGEFAGKPR